MPIRPSFLFGSFIRKSLAVIEAGSSSPDEVYSAIKRLRLRGESESFWCSIANEPSRPTFLRRAAIIQFFVRHAHGKALTELGLQGRSRWFAPAMISEPGFFCGSLPLFDHTGPNALLTLTPNLPEGNTSTIYLYCRPPLTEESARSAILHGTGSLASRVHDVGAGETLEDGSTVTWFRFRPFRRRFCSLNLTPQP